MNGIPFVTSKFAHSLRVELWSRIFGLTKTEVEDPVNDQLWWKMLSIGSKNSDLYKEVFRMIPDDSIKKFYEIPNFKAAAKLESYQKLVKNVQGFAVKWQQHWWSNRSVKVVRVLRLHLKSR